MCPERVTALATALLFIFSIDLGSLFGFTFFWDWFFGVGSRVHACRGQVGLRGEGGRKKRTAAGLRGLALDERVWALEAIQLRGVHIETKAARGALSSI